MGNRIRKPPEEKTFCKACGSRTKNRKPYCIKHICMMPYVQEVLRKSMPEIDILSEVRYGPKTIKKLRRTKFLTLLVDRGFVKILEAPDPRHGKVIKAVAITEKGMGYLGSL